MLTALFIGLGSIGTRHLKNLTAICAQRGLALRADALRSDLARPLRPGAAELLHSQFTTLQDSAALPHYDLAFITNPTSCTRRHWREIQRLADALFIEKPIVSAEQTDVDLATLLPAGQKAYVAAPMRWCGTMLALKNHLPGPAPLQCAGDLFLLPAGLAAGGGLPHGVQCPQGPGRRRDHRPDP